MILLFGVICSSFSQKYFYCNSQTFDEKDGYQSFGYPQFITQDHKAFVWIAGDNGLYRFDGTHFKNYRHSSNDTNSLPFNFVTFNYQDKRGNYWVTVPDFGLYNFYPRTGSFKKFAYANEGEFIKFASMEEKSVKASLYEWYGDLKKASEIYNANVSDSARSEDTYSYVSKRYWLH